jgi:hypothetical protein
MVHERHFTREQADAAVAQLEQLLPRLKQAKDSLTDEEARAALSDAAPGNGGGDPGRQVGESFLEVRRLLGELGEMGVVLRDIDRGLIDFPAWVDEREVYLCWQLGEDRVSFWHDLEAGFQGRQPLG